MKDIREFELTTKILLSMIMGIFIGLIINLYQLNETGTFIHIYIVNGLFSFLGDIFIMLLQMLVVPLVFFSLVSGVISVGNVAILGRVGIKAFLLYLFTTTIATTTAVLLSICFLPHTAMKTEGLHYVAQEVPMLNSLLSSIIPNNVFKAFAEGEMLQVIFFALFFSLAFLSLHSKNQNMEKAIETINQIIMKMVYMVTYIAPLAVFALIAKPIAELGLELLVELSSYILLSVFVLLVHLFGTLMLLLKIMTRVPLSLFIKKMLETQLFAFSTASSNATMPSTLQTLTEKMGVHSSISAFTIPFGATINMDGTAIMQGVATVFVANAYGIPLEIHHYFIIIGMSLLASIGTAGVPSVGLVMLSMIFVQIGIPIAGVALLLGVDRLLDMRCSTRGKSR